jgi:K+-transporting ATPase c subunit
VSVDNAPAGPVGAVTASGSGLDLEVVLGLVDGHCRGRGWGFLGEPGVHVLDLDLALERAG